VTIGLRIAVVLLAGAIAECAASRPAPVPHVEDPERVFQYGMLQFDGTRFLLGEQSLEQADTVWPVLILEDVPDDTPVCIEVSSEPHVEQCRPLRELRKLLAP